MVHIISGTDRPGSSTRKIAQIVFDYYQDLGAEVELLDMADWPADAVEGRYGNELTGKPKEWVDKLSSSDGFHIIAPEYNASIPGTLKHFIDSWKYPETFEHRAVAFVGLGGRFGGLRAVEHLHQVFAYRNAYQLPERVFFHNVWHMIKDGKITDPMVEGLLKNQVKCFLEFIKALKTTGLHTLTRPSRP